MPAKRLPLLSTLALAACLAARAGAAEPAADEPFDSVIYRGPKLETARVVKVFPEKLADLWLRALDRPEMEYRCQAALAIARAHGEGMKGLEAAVAPLTRELEREGQHPAVRLAAAKALVALEARTSSAALARLAEASDADLRELVEPALARWRDPAARDLWLRRVAEPSARGRKFTLAVDGLVALREQEAVPVLRGRMLSPTELPPTRLEAARALAALRPSGFEEDAGRLMQGAPPDGQFARLLAATLLRHHSGAAAVRLLEELARDPEPTVVAVALARLVEIDPKLVLPMLDGVLGSPDANVRTLGVTAIAQLPSEAHVRRLGERLVDPHPRVRVLARRALKDAAARADLREPVIREGVKSLAGSDWRGQEQGAGLLAQLGHKPAAPRLVELLPTDRPEVRAASAWGLRVLAVDDTVPAALEYLRLRHRQLIASATTRQPPPFPMPGIDEQMCQLAQLMGKTKHAPASSALVAILPRLVPGLPQFPPLTPVGVETRAAAAWALGLIHDGSSPPPAVVSALEARLTDQGPFGLEDDRVRRTASVSLGGLKAQSSVETLRKFGSNGGPALTVVNRACDWAISQITGEPMPPVGTAEERQVDWFLKPLR